jgi:hypothetical protein
LLRKLEVVIFYPHCWCQKKVKARRLHLGAPGVNGFYGFVPEFFGVVLHPAGIRIGQ